MRRHFIGRSRRDRRWVALLLTLGGVVLGGQLLYAISENQQAGPISAVDPVPGKSVSQAVHELPMTPAISALSSHADPARHAASAQLRELDRRFRQGLEMLARGEHEHAFTAFHRVLEIEPDLVDAHVNIGFALLGMERYPAALEFFIGATELKSDQANAYYGMAMSLEGLGKLQAALEAMETYLHLEKKPSEHTRRADAATWEWRYRLAGMPLTEEELKAEILRRSAARERGETSPPEQTASGY
jgi:tetratricopeptide (TPR) repeat protein